VDVAQYRNRFLDRKDLPTCLAPWHALTVKWGGNVIPDIIYKGKLGNLNEQTLPEIFAGRKYRELREAHRSRELPDTCIGCQKKEKSGRSRRMYFWDKLDFDVREASVDLDKNTVPDIRYLDFTLSNKCNIACIHCNPFVSSAWTKDGKKLNKEAPEYWEKAQVGYHGADISLMDNLFANPEYFRNLQWVALRGGEPLYDETCIEVLRWFVDQGLAENIMLDISTNATVFDDEFYDLFSKFKHVELLISVEATDELYQIIRGGKNYDWAQLNENIEKFYKIPNMEVVFAVTVMISNIFALDKVWEWFDKYHKHRASISMSNVVVHPGYLDIGMMPAELKALALDKIKHIPAEAIWPVGSYHAEEMEYQTGIDAIRDGLQREISVTEEEREQKWQWFLQYTRDLDRLRDHDTFEYIEEIKNYVQQ
jgi:MoaA/NifB/PqqE/SkfB family radical SAM enzyme